MMIPSCMRSCAGRAFTVRAMFSAMLLSLLGACGADGSTTEDTQSPAGANAKALAASPFNDAGPLANAVFVTQPADIAVVPGQQAAFTAKVAVMPGDAVSWRIVAGEGGQAAHCDRSTVVRPAISGGATTIELHSCFIGSQTIAQNGSQFSVSVQRADQSEGFESRVATLTFTATPFAPVFITDPAAQAVPAGQSATFRAEVAGTARLAWQWLKNGVAIPGATGNELTIATAEADADSSAAISVRVSNSAGSTESESTTLSIFGTTTAVGTAGGGVPGPDGSSLGVPEGALTGNVNLGITTQTVPDGLVPAGATALGPLIVIAPANVAFATPAELRLQAPAETPPGMAVAVARVDESRLALLRLPRPAGATNTPAPLGLVAFQCVNPTDIASNDRTFVVPVSLSGPFSHGAGSSQ